MLSTSIDNYTICYVILQNYVYICILCCVIKEHYQPCKGFNRLARISNLFIIRKEDKGEREIKGEGKG